MIERQRQTDKHREQSYTGSSVIGWWEHEAALRVNCVSFQSFKKFIKITKKKTLRAVEHNNAALNSFIQKYALNSLTAAWFEPLPGIHLPGCRDELQLKRGDDSHAELTDTQCFKQLPVGVHSPCKAFAVLQSLWLLLADLGSSCYVLRLFQICSGVLL